MRMEDIESDLRERSYEILNFERAKRARSQKICSSERREREARGMTSDERFFLLEKNVFCTGAHWGALKKKISEKEKRRKQKEKRKRREKREKKKRKEKEKERRE